MGFFLRVPALIAVSRDSLTEYQLGGGAIAYLAVA